MPQPALTDIFGASAVVDTGVLSVTLSELPGTLGSDPSSEAIVAAISQAALEAQDTDPEAEMVITKITRAQATRNNKQFTRYRYQHDYYTPVPELDPGNL